MEKTRDYKLELECVGYTSTLRKAASGGVQGVIPVF